MSNSRFGTIGDLKLSGLILKFSLFGSNVEFANALRRVMIAEVPTLAIDIVTVESNSSVLPDEMICHRLGLLPINSAKAMRMLDRTECGCEEACAHCSAKFTLDVTCDDDPITITQKDVRPLILEGDSQLPEMITPIIPPFEDTPEKESDIIVCKLRKKQAIKMAMIAYKGIGKVHAKWSPVANASFRYEPILKINPNLQNIKQEDKQRIVDICHKNVFELDNTHDAIFNIGSNDDEVLTATRPLDCVFCGDCENEVHNLGMRGAISITTVPGTFHFTIESTGVLPPGQIVFNALTILRAKYDQLGRECVSLRGVEKAAQETGATGTGGGHSMHIDLS